MNPFVSDDGYTSTAFIRGNDNRPHLRLHFRPTTAGDRSAFQDQLDAVDLQSDKANVRLNELYAAGMAQRIVRWEWLKDDGSAFEFFTQGAKKVPVPKPTKDSLVRIQEPSLWARIRDIVLHGDDHGDPDPFNGQDPVKTPAEQLENDQKNSGKG